MQATEVHTFMPLKQKPVLRNGAASTWIGSPAIHSNGVIYFGTSGGFSLVGLDAKTGSQKLLQVNDFYNFAQPQANADRVFFATVSGQLYSYQLD